MEASIEKRKPECEHTSSAKSQTWRKRQAGTDTGNHGPAKCEGGFVPSLGPGPQEGQLKPVKFFDTQEVFWHTNFTAAAFAWSEQQFVKGAGGRRGGCCKM